MSLTLHTTEIWLHTDTDSGVLEDVGIEEINAAVYDVAHKRARLFHIMQNLNEQEQPS